VTLNDLKTPKYEVLVIFCDFRLQRTCTFPYSVNCAGVARGETEGCRSCFTSLRRAGTAGVSTCEKVGHQRSAFTVVGRYAGNTLTDRVVNSNSSSSSSSVMSSQSALDLLG